MSLSITMYAARQDKHGEGPNFSYWLSMLHQRYRPQPGWLQPRCQCRCWLPSGGARFSACPVVSPHREYRWTGVPPQRHRPQGSGPTGHPAQLDMSYPESETAHQVGDSADARALIALRPGVPMASASCLRTVAWVSFPPCTYARPIPTGLGVLL